MYWRFDHRIPRQMDQRTIADKSRVQGYKRILLNRRVPRQIALDEVRILIQRVSEAYDAHAARKLRVLAQSRYIMAIDENQLDGRFGAKAVLIGHRSCMIRGLQIPKAKRS